MKLRIATLACLLAFSTAAFAQPPPMGPGPFGPGPFGPPLPPPGFHCAVAPFRGAPVWACPIKPRPLGAPCVCRGPGGVRIYGRVSP